jgi:hypothetical protein
MSKTLITLLTAASFLAMGTAQAADKLMDKPPAESAVPAKHAKKAPHTLKHAKKRAHKAAGTTK